MATMEKPTLIIMAAGMGSRYGGLKQIDPVSDKGEIILDFSLYDAMMAGFEKVIFIIKKENEADFRALIDERAENTCRWNTPFRSLLTFLKATRFQQRGKSRGARVMRYSVRENS